MVGASACCGMEVGFTLGTLSVVLWYLWNQKTTLRKLEDAYQQEHRGRCNLEKKLKVLTNTMLSHEDGVFVHEIGVLESCYKQCIGTPRQGLLVPHSRAHIRLCKRISPEAFDGLEEFSHVWILFRFHLNTDSHKEVRQLQRVAGGTEEVNTNRFTFTAKVTPPMLKEKKGIELTTANQFLSLLGL